MSEQLPKPGMSEDYILRQIIGAFNPEDALLLPFDEQRGIIREITGYTVSDPAYAVLYLEYQELDVLVDDPMVAASMRQDLRTDGYTLPSVEDLRDYLATNDPAVLMRNKDNWEVVEERYPERFPAIYLEAGTRQALKYFEELQGREVEPEEARIAFWAALQAGDFPALQYIEELDYGIMLDHNNQEDRQRLVQLTDKQLRNAVAFEDQGADDFTTFLLPAYYLERAVVPAMYFLSLLDERSRNIIWSNLPGWANDDPASVRATIGLDLSNPVVQAYLEVFPEDEAAQEILIGGEIALRQINYPDFGEYSRSRGPWYFAEQRYRVLSRHQGWGITPREVEEVRQEVNSYRREAGKEEIPPPQ